jgi:hypothetical protein
MRSLRIDPVAFLDGGNGEGGVRVGLAGWSGLSLEVDMNVCVVGRVGRLRRFVVMVVALLVCAAGLSLVSFSGSVSALKLLPVLEGLEIWLAGGAEADAIASEAGRLPDAGDKTFLLDASNGRGYVMASSIEWAEDNGSYDEPSSIVFP